MRKSWIAPAAALIFGAAGLVLRRRELAGAFEPDTGLAVKGAGETVAMAALTAAVIAGIVIFTLLAVRGRTAPEMFRKAFYTGSFASFAVSFVMGLAVIAGAVIFVLNREDFLIGGAAMWIFAVFALGTGISLLVMDLCEFTQKESPTLFLVSVIPSLFFCYWLVLLYRENAGNPTLLEYCYGCFAFAAASVSFYYAAGFAYGRRKTRATVAFNLLAIYLMMVTLADAHNSGLKLVIGGSVGFLALNTARLLGGLEKKPEEAAEAPENKAQE
ncbi:MAG: hypothetical protein ACI3VB_05120 [Oscillospiraceae bacterium]